MEPTTETSVTLERDGSEAEIACEGRRAWRREGCIVNERRRTTHAKAYAWMLKVIRSSVADGWMVIRATRRLRDGRMTDVTAAVKRRAGC